MPGLAGSDVDLPQMRVQLRVGCFIINHLYEKGRRRMCKDVIVRNHENRYDEDVCVGSSSTVQVA